jgi:hypothetical protein
MGCIETKYAGSSSVNVEGGSRGRCSQRPRAHAGGGERPRAHAGEPKKGEDAKNKGAKKNIYMAGGAGELSIIKL